MSAETITWLNRMTLIGFTEKRGEAWHYRAEDQDDQGNHFEGPIPQERVAELLDRPQLTEATVSVTYATSEGVTTTTDDTRKAYVRPAGAFGDEDPGAVLGVFKSGHQLHRYNEWLVGALEVILDDGLALSSAGLLRGGAVAFVQVEMPDTIETPEGVAFRPFLSAATSCDGSLASTYQTGSQVIVCDNTLAAALGEKAAARIKVKHSKKSLGRIGEVRSALDIVHSAADTFAAEVEALCAMTVTDKQWAEFLTAHVGDAEDMRKTDKSRTILTRKHDELNNLWNNDSRVNPWKGTAYGVLAAVNTHAHHIGTVKRTDRVERNMLRAVTGEYDKLDNTTIDTLLKVLA